MENMNKCPCCSHHCDRNNLQCRKGEAYFNGESTADAGRSHGHHENKRHGKGHHHPEFPAGSLADLLSRCGRNLFHGGSSAMFDVLTEAEQAALKELLGKLLNA